MQSWVPIILLTSLLVMLVLVDGGHQLMLPVQVGWSRGAGAGLGSGLLSLLTGGVETRDTAHSSTSTSTTPAKYSYSQLDLGSLIMTLMKKNVFFVSSIDKARGQLSPLQ